MRTAARLAVVLVWAGAACGAWGAVSWDEHPVVDGVRWTGRTTRFREFTIGSDREGGRALEAGTTGVVVLPAELNGSLVKDIDARAFAGLEGLAEVVLPEGLRGIGEEAFAGCTGLRRVVVPSSTHGVGAGAFAGCTALQEVVIGTNVCSVGERAFEGCTALERIEMPEGPRMAEIGSRAFAGCTGLRKFRLSPRVSVVREEAFAGCTGLEELELPAGEYFKWMMLVLERRAFAGCARLERVAWTRPVRVAFRDGEDAGGSDVFEGCTGIREVLFHTKWPGENGMSAVFPDAFGNIRRVECLEGSTEIFGGMFRGCAELEEVVLPESVTAMGAGVFEGCGKLKAVRWPTGLREVDPEALRGSSIEEGPVVAGNQDGEAAE